MMSPGAAADMGLDLEIFVTPGLGDNSYVVASGDEAVVVDPQRDAWRFLEVAERRGWRIRHVLETHVHNDYVSGAHDIRAATRATLVVPARGRYAFEHVAADEGDEVLIGDLRLTARATPGHTPEHLAWEVRRTHGSGPEAVFTGGSLLVGAAGRSDLLGPEVAEPLAREQYRSIQRLANLPDTVRVLPTHGAGSFCVSGTAGGDARTSTLGAERFGNPAVWGTDEDAFVREHLGGLLAFPAYYRHMAPLNRTGAAVLGGRPSLPALDGAQVAALTADGAWIVDARDRRAFAAGHLPGSINIELDDSFGGYVGWVVPFGERIILVLPDDGDSSGEASSGAAAMTQLLRIGYDRVVGSLAGGVASWVAAGHEVRAYETASMGDLLRARGLGGAGHESRPVPALDVRQAEEWRATPGVPDAQRIFVGDLAERTGAVAAVSHATGEAVWVYCATGFRASLAASLLDRAGVPVRLVSSGGAADWPRISP